MVMGSTTSGFAVSIPSFIDPGNLIAAEVEITNAGECAYPETFVLGDYCPDFSTSKECCVAVELDPGQPLWTYPDKLPSGADFKTTCGAFRRYKVDLVCVVPFA